MWVELKTVIRFPRGSEDAAKKNTLGTMRKSFQG
uniref:Uncharacterized protein n=1 Tax=Arundo donax TaxID=35708 RepID=A0A0A8YDK5_ARUDO